jgi:ligand-binding sensor protein
MKCKSIQFSKTIISPITITDFYVIFLSIGNLITNKNNTPNSFTTSKINTSKLSNLIATQSRETFLDKNDVNEATDNFINIIKNLTKKATNNIKISSKLKKIKP